MMSKFVEKCKICRKMMSNLRKMMSKFAKNDVEICLTGEICRKMRNLSKNDVEFAKNDVEICLTGEICRNCEK